MKRVFAVLLSAIMLFGIMSTVAFAVDAPNPWELEDFGQKSWTLKVTDNAPVIDGKINEGEYAIAETGIAVANRSTDGRLFVVDSPSSDIVFDVYMDYDGDRFYLGVVIDGPELIEEVAANGTVDGRLIVTLGCDKNNYNRTTMFKAEVSPDDVSADGVDEMLSSIDGTKLTYEFAISKNAMLDQYGIDEFELVYIMLLIIDVTDESLQNPDLWNEIYFGFKSSDLSPTYPGGAPRYAHVVFFDEAEDGSDAPETSAPETDAPSTEKGGCGSSVAAVSVALVATLGTCTAFISKKR